MGFFFFFLIVKMIVMEDWPKITTNRCESDSCMIRHIGVEIAPGCSPHPCHITPSISFLSFPMNRKSRVHGLAWPLQPLCPFLTHAHFMPTFPYPYSYPFLHTHWDTPLTTQQAKLFHHLYKTRHHTPHVPFLSLSNLHSSYTYHTSTSSSISSIPIPCISPFF